MKGLLFLLVKKSANGWSGSTSSSKKKNLRVSGRVGAASEMRARAVATAGGVDDDSGERAVAPRYGLRRREGGALAGSRKGKTCFAEVGGRCGRRDGGGDDDDSRERAVAPGYGLWVPGRGKLVLRRPFKVDSARWKTCFRRVTRSPRRGAWCEEGKEGVSSKGRPLRAAAAVVHVRLARLWLMFSPPWCGPPPRLTCPWPSGWTWEGGNVFYGLGGRLLVVGCGDGDDDALPGLRRCSLRRTGPQVRPPGGRNREARSRLVRAE